jgi:hypothetical protein
VPIVAKAKSKDFVPAPEGLHRAVCVDVTDLGMVIVEYKGNKKLQHKILISWQIEERIPETGKPFIVSKRYTNSLHKKATLRSDLESWRGKRFTDQELEGFDLERLLKVNCQINVTHNKVEDDTYANVISIVPAAKGLPPLVPEDYIRRCNRPDYVPPPMEGESIPDEPGTDAEEEVPF